MSASGRLRDQRSPQNYGFALTTSFDQGVALVGRDIAELMTATSESDGRTVEVSTATSLAFFSTCRCCVGKPYALHTIVLRDLYDFLDVITVT